MATRRTAFGWFLTFLFFSVFLGIAGAAFWVLYKAGQSQHTATDQGQFTHLPQGTITAIKQCKDGIGREYRDERTCDLVTEQATWSQVKVGYFEQGVRKGDALAIQYMAYPRERITTLCIDRVCRVRDVCQDWMTCWDTPYPPATPNTARPPGVMDILLREVPALFKI